MQHIQTSDILEINSHKKYRNTILLRTYLQTKITKIF